MLSTLSSWGDEWTIKKMMMIMMTRIRTMTLFSSTALGL